MFRVEEWDMCISNLRQPWIKCENCDTHGQPKERSQSAEGTLTVSRRNAHGQLKLRSRSAQGTLMRSSGFSHAQFKARSWSAHEVSWNWVSCFKISHGRPQDTQRLLADLSVWTGEGRIMIVWVCESPVCKTHTHSSSTRNVVLWRCDTRL